MIRKASKFYFKVYIKNILFLLIFSGVLFFSLVNKDTVNYSIKIFTKTTTFGMIFSTFGIMILGAYISGKNYENLNYLEYDKYKKFIAIILGGIKVIALLYLIPLIVIIMNINLNNTIIFNIKGLIHFSLIWFLSNICTLTIGVFVGTFIHGFFRYIICTIIFLLFNQTLITQSSTTINKMFNIFDDELHSPSNYCCSVIFNKFYLLDKTFIICLILFIFIFVYLLTTKKNYTNLIISIIGFIVIESLVVYTGDKSRLIINNDHCIQTSSNITSNKDLKYSVDNYYMKLILDNKLYNKCNIKLNISSSKVKQLEFLLNKTFKIKKVKINNKPVDYKRCNNKIILYTKNLELKNNQDVNLYIEYAGKICAENTSGTNIVYVNHDAINLLSNTIDWYPKLLQNKESYYDVNINSTSKIYSNLPAYSKENKKSSYNFKIKGKTKGLNIVSGNYTHYTYKNMKIIVPKNLNKSSINSGIDYALNKELINYIKDNKNMLNKTEIDRIKNKNFKKIILVPYGSIDIDIFEDTIIMDAPI